MELAPYDQTHSRVRQEESGLDDIASDPQISERLLTPEDLLGLQPGDDAAFDEIAAKVFERQRIVSPTYRVFSQGFEWEGWRSAPFLPVEAFKWDGIVSPEFDPDVVFLSSATGGKRSRHPVADLRLVDRLAIEWFRTCVGSGPFRFLAHLPSYQAAGQESSLVYMVETLMRAFGAPESEFVLGETTLADNLKRLAGDSTGDTIILFGTAFGLLDLVEKAPLQLPGDALVIETGGMKSRRREIDRTTLHTHLSSGFGLPRYAIRSEYGMCEMVSQFYSLGHEAFAVPPWVRVKIVDPDNPTRDVDAGSAGLLAVFDLGNVNSVSPILTSDLARKTPGGIEIVGRVAGAELRGCNFLIDQNL